MEKIDRELLIKEIGSRLSYGIKAQVLGWDEEKGEVEVPLRIYSINTEGYVYFETNNYDVNYLRVDECLLYLRPMSSMTKDEKKELLTLLAGKDAIGYFQVENSGITNTDKHTQFGPGWEYHWLNFSNENISLYVDWLNAHYFDYRGLIEKGLAFEAPEGMYNIK